MILARRYKFYILLFFILLLPYSYFFHWIGGWNESSRLDLVYSIVERHTLNIDAYHENTGDKAFYKGHYYTEKAPGLSFFAVPVYIFIKAAVLIFKLPISFAFPNSLTIFYLLTLICIGVPSALLGIIFYKFTGYFTNNRKFQLAVALSYSLATMAFPYATLFVGHQFSAALGFAAFFIAFRMKQKKCEDWKQLMLVGFVSGYAIISEYPMAIVAAALFFYTSAFLKSKKNIAFFILGALPPILLLIYYNYKCVGNPFIPTYKYLVFIPEFEGAKKGLFGIGNFSFRSLYGITFGPYRGLFRTSPILLLSMPGFYYLFKKREYRPEYYFYLFVASAFVFMNSSYYAWDGGATMGPRHIIPALPFISIGLVFFLEGFRGNRWAKSIFRVLFMFSFLMMLFGTAVDPRLPTVNIDVNNFIFLRLLFGSYTPNPTVFYHSFNLGTLLFNYLFPILLWGHFVLTLMPLLVFLAGASYWLVKDRG